MASYDQLYRIYIPVPFKEPDASGFISVRCPFIDNHAHGDKNASAGISVESGVFNCYKCGPMSLSTFLQRIANMSEDEALDTIDEFRQSHGLIERIETFNNRPPRFSPMFEDLVLKSKQYMDPEETVVQEYLRSRRLEYSTLLHLEVGLLPAHETHWGRQSLVFPYTYNKQVVAVRYRDAAGNKGGEQNCHFTLWGIDELDDDKEVVILAEGETDRLAIWQAVQGEYTVVSSPTATFQRQWAREFEGIRQVILLAQADDAAPKMVDKARAALGDKLTVLELPWRRREFGKDACDWIKNHSEEEFRNLIKGTVTPVYRRILSGKEMREVASDEPDWLIKGLLGRRNAAIIGGPAKAMKTWLALNIVRCLLSPGEPLCGIPELVSVPEKARILIVEEEGSLTELKKRAEVVLEGTDWEEQTFWSHHLGVRLDESAWVQKLIKNITELKIDLLILDPLQRLHTQDENDASKMGLVWNAVDQLLVMFPELSIIVLHHFKKAADVGEGWNAFRGSSRLAGEVDLGIFVERRAASEATGIKVKFIGRNIPDITTADNKDIFKLAFKDGRFTLDSGQVHIGKHTALIAEMKERRMWSLKEAAQHFEVSVDTVRNWVKKLPDELEIASPAPGRPAAIIYKEG
jgi:hypothetical protein